MSDDRTIFHRMVDILDEMPAIGKNQTNQQQRFQFRGHEDVMNALNPLLAKHGVFVVPEVLERVRDHRTTNNGSTMYETSLLVRYRFYGLGGDFVEASVWGEGTDMGDKDTSKAMTMAFKSVLAQAFAISTEELSDADASSPEPTRRWSEQSAAAPPQGGEGAPAAARQAPGGGAAPTAAQKKLRTNLLSELGRLDDTRDWESIITSWVAKEFNGLGIEQLTRSQYDSMLRKMERTRDALNEQGVTASSFPPASEAETAAALEQAGIGDSDVEAPLSGAPTPTEEELPSL